ncbi:phage tail protein, partial [Serratia sp. IR-2025]
TGTIYGMFVIESISETHSEFFADGSPRRTEFTLNLKRVDESLSAMFGDLRQQAGELYDKAGEMAGKAAGAMGGLLS